MPKSSIHLTLARHWEILKKLPHAAPGITAGDLTRFLQEEGQFQVSKRTVERDLIELARLFGIKCNDRCPPFGWHWLPGRQCDFTSIDVADAMSLVLAESALQSMLPSALLEQVRPRFALAHAKLAALKGHRYSKWAAKVRYVPPALPVTPPAVVPKVLREVQEALAAEQQLSVSYLGPRDSRPSDLRLHTLALVQRGAVSYLVASAYEYSDVRLYALHRIRSATILDDKVIPPRGFSLDNYLKSGAMDFKAGDSVSLEARVSADLAIYLAETPLGCSQTLRAAAADYILRVDLADSWQLRWWILSQGTAITVLKPKWLRDEIREVLANACDNYAAQR